MAAMARPAAKVLGAGSGLLGAACLGDYYTMSPLRGSMGWESKHAWLRARNSFAKMKGQQEIDLIELSRYNGQNDQPIYMAAQGVIWDVSTSPSFGKSEDGTDDGQYSVFAGRDGTLALATMSLDESLCNATGRWKELEGNALDGWVAYFDEMYPRTGVLREWVRGEDISATEVRCLEQNGQRKGVQVLPSGVQYEVLKAGTGARLRNPPADSKSASATIMITHYSIKRLDGVTLVDSSKLEQGRAVALSKADLPVAWHEGMKNMKVGERRLIWMPAGTMITDSVESKDKSSMSTSPLQRFVRIDMEVLKEHVMAE